MVYKGISGRKSVDLGAFFWPPVSFEKGVFFGALRRNSGVFFCNFSLKVGISGCTEKCPFFRKTCRFWGSLSGGHFSVHRKNTLFERAKNTADSGARPIFYVSRGCARGIPETRKNRFCKFSKPGFAISRKSKKHENFNIFKFFSKIIKIFLKFIFFYEKIKNIFVFLQKF